MKLVEEHSIRTPNPHKAAKKLCVHVLFTIKKILDRSILGCGQIDFSGHPVTFALVLQRLDTDPIDCDTKAHVTAASASGVESVAYRPRSTAAVTVSWKWSLGLHRGQRCTEQSRGTDGEGRYGRGKRKMGRCGSGVDAARCLLCNDQVISLESDGNKRRGGRHRRSTLQIRQCVSV